MTKIETPTLLTFDGIIAQCASWCVEHGEKASALITGKTLDLCDHETIRALAVKGLMYEVNNRLHYDRDQQVSSVIDQELSVDQVNTYTADERTRRATINSAQGRNPGAAGVGSTYSPLDTPMLGASTLKPLRDFDLADIQSLKRMCAGLRSGWQRREDWCSTAEDMLSASKKAKTVSELKASQVKQLEELARETWERKAA